MKLNPLFLCALLLPLLAGCEPVPAPKEPHVSIETVSHPVLFTGNYTQMTEREMNSLAVFLDGFKPTAVSGVTLASNGVGPVSVARARNMRNYLVAHGVDKQVIRMQPVEEIGSSSIVLTVRYAKPIVPAGCPDWSRNSIIDYENAGGSNFGCAYGADFIQQLADPADYNGGHGTPVYDPARDSVAIGKYMSGAAAAASSSSSSSTGSAGGSTTTTTSTP